jgi:uncharacterized phiE125 gp8 family phage protein
MSPIVRDWEVTVEPEFEPISRTLAKLHARVETEADDLLIDLLIKAARLEAERITGRAFIPRTIEARFDDLPSGREPIELPMAHSATVSELTYLDGGGAAQTIDLADLEVIAGGQNPARLIPAVNTNWPGTNRSPGNVVITYVAGYPASGSPADEEAHQAAIPEALKNWMLVRVTTSYDHRGALDMGNLKELPRDFVDSLLDGLQLRRGFA